MPQNSVRAILQDRLGFLWLATQNGLVRYDGYDFKIYRNVPDDSTTISAGDLFVLVQDAGGSIWIGHQLGIDKFDWSEIAYSVGFNKVDLFSKLFKQVFGVSPSKFANQD